MKYNIDFHIHSNASLDGTYTPKEIIDMACSERMKVISIADHNTCQGIVQALEYQKVIDTDLKLITGIEIDCHYLGYDLHVLGYGINPYDSSFGEIETYMKTIEYEAGMKRVKLIEDIFNIKLNMDNLLEKSSNDIITGEVIADELLSNEKYDSLESMKLYQPKGMRADNPLVNFYWDFCSQNKLAYVPLNLPSLEFIVDVIKETHGIPVLAHPGNNIHENTDILQSILKQGFAGIEVISSYHSKEQMVFYLKAADENEVIATCGSDYHGRTKPAIKVGEFNFIFDEKILLNNLLEAIERK